MISTRRCVASTLLPIAKLQASYMSSTPISTVMKEWERKLLMKSRYDGITKRGENRDKVQYRRGDLVHGFECVSVLPVPELNVTAYQFIHKKTRADYLHIDASDTDNVFR